MKKEHFLNIFISKNMVPVEVAGLQVLQGTRRGRGIHLEHKQYTKMKIGHYTWHTLYILYF